MRTINTKIILKIAPITIILLFIWMLGNGLSLYVLYISTFLIIFPLVYIFLKALIKKIF